MLVFAPSEPPFTRMRPSGRFVVPGQNMSWPVFETSVSVAVSVAGSNSAVYVLPDPFQFVRLNDDHSSTLPFGNPAAATGTMGVGMTADHFAAPGLPTRRPCDSSSVGALRGVQAARVRDRNRGRRRAGRWCFMRVRSGPRVVSGD